MRTTSDRNLQCNIYCAHELHEIVARIAQPQQVFATVSVTTSWKHTKLKNYSHLKFSRFKKTEITTHAINTDHSSKI